jgi:hypothetical protein
VNCFSETPYTIVTDGEYKLATDGDKTELFALPDEETDRSDSESGHVSRLRSSLEEYNISWGGEHQQSKAEFDQSQIEQLEDLGYL